MSDKLVFPAKPNEAYRVHTSDRLTYRRCRRLFVFSANVLGAMGLEPLSWQKDLWLGTGVHKALELWYRNDTYPSFTPAEYFKAWRKEWESKPGVVTARSEWDEDTRAEYQHYCNLGNSMLTHYLRYANETDNHVDRGFDIVETEVKFSTPILDPNGDAVYVDWPCPNKGMCQDHEEFRPHYIALPAVYEGRFDGIVRDRLGRYWILEHKTFKVYDERKMFNDDQSGSYLWAARRIYGYKFAGILYNVLLKKTPVIPPVVYKGTKKERLSTDVRGVLRMTTPYLYRQAIVDAGYDEADYAEQLEMLDDWGWSNFFKRTYIERNPNEINEVGLRIYYETMEMSNTNTMFYPNPDGMRCPWCSFRVPCMALSGGDDFAEILRENYRKRESTDVDIFETEFMPE